MIPTTQTILHDPENGKHGNCLSAVLASLLHFPIESIPVFNSTTWLADLNSWLRPRVLAFLSITRASFDLVFSEQGIRECFHEAGGLTDRFSDVHHACVAKDGDIIFDPHPSRAGLTDVDTCGIFIALEPWRMS